MARSGQDLARLLHIAAAQGGVVSLADLGACGFSSKAVRHRLHEGTWHRIGGAVVLTPSGSNNAERGDIALAWILRFTFGAQMRISGSLALRRARWHVPCEAHIVILTHKPTHALTGVTVLRRSDSTPSGGTTVPRFVTPREALVDCLTVLPADSAVDVLDSALQRRYVSPDTVAADLRARLGRGRLNAAGLHSLIARALSGSRSEAEQRMARLLRRSGTGPWVPNHPLLGSDGRVVAELDFAHLGLRIAIEVDGRAFHSDRRAFEHDRWRQNALTLGGWLVLRFTWEQIIEHPAEVIAVIRRAVDLRAA